MTSFMLRRLFPLNRLQRKVVNTILVMVVVPMLVAGGRRLLDPALQAFLEV